MVAARAGAPGVVVRRRDNVRMPAEAARWFRGEIRALGARPSVRLGHNGLQGLPHLQGAPLRSLVLPEPRRAIPFARRVDTDDTAAFGPDGSVLIIHDYASPGWELVDRYDSFDAWADDPDRAWRG